MSLFVDCQFVDTISHLLRNFRRKTDYLYNFSCPICGDSKTKKLKARGYLLRSKGKDGIVKDGLFYKCHKCGITLNFPDFLKSLDNQYYKEYILETFKDGVSSKKSKVPKKWPDNKKEQSPAKPMILIGCPAIATLGDDHLAKEYIKSRKIPELFWKQIFWCEDFKILVDKLSPDNKYELKDGDKRIILPCLDRQGNIMAIIGRTLEPNADVRYLIVKAYDDAPRIYGMHRLSNTWKRIYLVEGAFDSMFLPNSLAMCGSDIPNSLPRENVVIVYDNEPTKQETRDKILKTLKNGWKCCIWPNSIEEKDINEMILAGYTSDFIRATIDQNSYNGQLGIIKLTDWKRPHNKPKGEI
jgi:hypothetical protein